MQIFKIPSFHQIVIIIIIIDLKHPATFPRLACMLRNQQPSKPLTIAVSNTCSNFSSIFDLVALQEALAQAFEHELPLLGTEKSYFGELSSMLEKKRDLMAKLLTEVGFKPTIPEGGYFMMADTSDIGEKYTVCLINKFKSFLILHATRFVMSLILLPVYICRTGL